MSEPAISKPLNDGGWWARWVGSRPPTRRQLLAAVRGSACVFLPRIETGWVGASIALIGVALGVWTVQPGRINASVLGWVALGLVVLGMIIHTRWRRMDSGWDVDFDLRQISPRGQAGEVSTLAVTDHCIVCGPGDKWRSLVIDVRHKELGRVARLMETVPLARMSEHRAISALADALAQRLGLAREGVQL